MICACLTTLMDRSSKVRCTNTLPIRASITGGWEPADSDVEEREKRREKEPGASRDAGEMRATYTVAAALPLKNYHVAAAC